MRDAAAPKISKWPFLAGDALLLWTAAFICLQTKLPMGAAELSLSVGCVFAGALLAITPFILDYRAIVRLTESDGLLSVASQIKDLDKIASQIAGATGRWQNVQEESEKTATSAKAIAERMAEEVKAFTEFMQRVNDSEKSTLRLEVEKLRRGETDWVQVLVRLLDHVYALHTASVRSGQPRLIEQLTHFQHACRDTARRVGLVPFLGVPAELFDPQRHQCVDGEGKPLVPAEGAKVADTIATGYTFQGRLLRPVLVRLQDGAASGSVPSNPEKQSQLPLVVPAEAAHPPVPSS